MGKFKQNKDDYQNKTEQEFRKSEWLDECQANGCNLKPHSMVAGYHLCSFHMTKEAGEGFRNWEAISYAISQNLGLIKKAYQLTSKTSDFWKDKTNVLALQGWDFFPMEENEWPSRYTDRLIRHVEALVADSATQALIHGVK